MSEEKDEPWSDEQIDKWNHNRCLKTHGNEIFRWFHAYLGTGPWKLLVQEEAVPEPESEAEPEPESAAESELIEETRASGKFMKEMEKEEEEKGTNAHKPEKCEDQADVSPDNKKKKDKGGKEEGASIDSPLRISDPLTFQPPDSPTDIDATIQKTN